MANRTVGEEGENENDKKGRVGRRLWHQIRSFLRAKSKCALSQRINHALLRPHIFYDPPNVRLSVLV